MTNMNKFARRTTLSSEYMLSITATINDPIQCGYFLAFCEHEHSVENILFVMEVDKFRDAFLVDSKGWPTKASDLDTKIFENMATSEFTSDMDINIQDLVNRNQWPSKFVRRKHVENWMKTIWDSYLCDTAINEICISHYILMRTKKRMDLVHVYGPGVFNEALYDPLVTLRDDALPRFRTSAMYNEMLLRMSALAVHPTADSLIVTSPKMNTTYIDPDNSIELVDILNDLFLYENFYEYVSKAYCSENLLCIRKIAEYEELMEYHNPPRRSSVINSIKSVNASLGGQTPPQAETCAWLIFRYFVALGSPYEITLSLRQRKDIMIGLAIPQKKLFEILKITAMGNLKTNFDSFKFTTEYVELQAKYSKHRLDHSKSENKCIAFMSRN